MSVKDELLKIIRSIVNPVGYDIVKYRATHPAHLILKHLKVNNINTLLDVGANAGQYSLAIRKAGFKARIVSFEPLSEAYNELKVNSSRDGNWQALNYALGDADSLSLINVSGHSPSSSFLQMTDTHKEVAPGSDYIRKEQIEIKTLDSVFSSLSLDNSNIFLKIDTQGYEKKVLDGATRSLDKIRGIQLELSATKLYEGEENYYSICSFLEKRNFRLVRIIPGFSDKVSGEMLQFDAIFFRKLN